MQDKIIRDEENRIMTSFIFALFIDRHLQQSYQTVRHAKSTRSRSRD